MRKLWLVAAALVGLAADVSAAPRDNYQILSQLCLAGTVTPSMRDELNEKNEDQFVQFLKDCTSGRRPSKDTPAPPPVVQVPPPAPPPPVAKAPPRAPAPVRTACAIRIDIVRPFHPVHVFRITAHGLRTSEPIVIRQVGGAGTYDVPVPCEYAEAQLVEVCLGLRPGGPARFLTRDGTLAVARANLARGVRVFNPDRHLGFIGGPPRDTRGAQNRRRYQAPAANYRPQQQYRPQQYRPQQQYYQ